METITYISHHGILGQKWGVRRYQNPDGSLTEAGKKRLERKANNRQSMADAYRQASDSIGTIADKYKPNKGKPASAEYTNLKLAKNAVGSMARANEKSAQGARDAARKVRGSELVNESKSMSEAELDSSIRRLQKEKQYRELKTSEIEAGYGYVYSHRRETINDIVTYTAPIVTTVVVPLLAKKWLKT